MSKPRIRKVAGINWWICSAWWAPQDGCGITPCEAFKNWKERGQNENQ